MLPSYFILKWALKPLWRGFRDWEAIRTITADRTRRFVVSVSGFLVNLWYEYQQDEWRKDTNTFPANPRRKLFTATDFLREQVWLASLSRYLLNIVQGLRNLVFRVIKYILRSILESRRVPSLVKLPLSASIVLVVVAKDELKEKAVQTWEAMLTDPASAFVTEVHDTEQGSKRDQNKTVYEPLSSPKDMIRLLRILPGIAGQELQCTVHVEGRSSAKHEALSYVWGDPTLQRSITVNGARYSVGKNLYDCLVHLRNSTTERDLWVDTLCINQADADERSQQVLLMGDLYKRAESVIVWLGLDVESVAELIAQTRENRDESPNRSAPASPKPLKPGHINAVQHLLCSSWWTRVWTVQELILNSTTTVQCGEHSLSWQSFCQMIDQGASQMKPSELQVTFYSQYLALKRERKLYHQHIARRYPLLERTYIFRGKQASLAVDKMFGFYGLLEDPSAEIKPEYVLNSTLVAEGFALDFINRYKSLAVVALAELSTPESENGARWEWYPCWNRDGSTSAKTLFWTGLGDEIGGQPWSEDAFDAANGRLVREWVDFDHLLSYTVELEGWQVDTVTMTGVVMTSQDVDGGQWESVLEQWLSMSCDPDDAADGQARPAQRLTLFYKTITAGLFDEKQLPGSPQHAKYLEAVREACRFRRLFLTSSGHCGLGPQDTACGDEIWILLGMAVPVVLGRRVAFYASDSDNCRRGEVDPTEPFRYLGQTYIHDLARPDCNSGGLLEESLVWVRIWSNVW
ncbi:uncharacterized protein PgNI_02226 [Pyricularia grisea]|uniref:Heterokaryon incompatibility domain-containing protein n=1 Tax=Pyricularia grisea TaxID=148305 RepID=A0A6P8BHC6_PYRGI|nr:uncharacterized protein PgNI_02226 [Pyricularia grisea]TLD16057.1 hypothetical protein PgNI_02226 [Pyricularia grisea]